jgi:hypothetical protein
MPCPDSCADAAAYAEVVRVTPPKIEAPRVVRASLSDATAPEGGGGGGGGVKIFVPPVVDVDAPIDVRFEIPPVHVYEDEDIVSLHALDASGEGPAPGWAVRDRWYRVTHDRLRHGITWEGACAAPATGLYQVCGVARGAHTRA